MKRFVVPVVTMAVLACPAVASEPRSAREATQVKHVPIERPAAMAEDFLVIPPQIPREMPRHRPLHVRLMEFVECPIKPIVEYVQLPNSRLRRLINESEDLRKAREQFQRFWISSTSRPF